MDRYYVEATKMTPEINLDAEKKIFSIRGNSRPENPKQFYQTVFDWLTEYFENSNDKTVFEIQMDYFNTSTSKILLDLFEFFEKFAESKDIHVIWYYQKNDEEMEEAGAELLDLVEISYELKEV